MVNYSGKLSSVIDNVCNVIVGKRDLVEKTILAVLTGGHILIEDVPGVGKTTLVNALSQVIGCTFSRIQFTPDLLPSDITGLTVFNIKTGAFEFKSGPIMANMILADEINRSSPKTQSSLLEAMQEGQITIDGNTYKLPKPFIVLATQNPIEYEGTFPLPEAQLDRFCMKLSLGYPDIEEEREIIRRFGAISEKITIENVITGDELLEIQREYIDKIYVEESLIRYILNIVQNTRNNSDIYLGASPRGTLFVFNLAKATAFLRGRSFVTPDDVKSIIYQALAHRIILKPEARIKGKTVETVLKEILDITKVPLVRHNV